MSVRHSKPLFFIIISILSILLSACGVGKADSSLDAVKDKPNGLKVNGGTPSDIKENGVSGTTDCATLTAANNNEFCVAIEANSAMVASNTTQNLLFDLITPQKTYAYLGLDTIAVKNIEVVQLSVQMGTSSSAAIPSYSYEITTNGVYRLIFDSSPTLRIDLAVKVTLLNNEILYAPLVAKNIAVNVVSNYQIKKFFNGITTFAELDNVISCNDTTSCTNQFDTKFIFWGALTGFLQGYEVIIPSSSNINSAMTLLEKDGDFNNQMNRFFTAIKKTGEFYVGTKINENSTINADNTESSTKEFNTTAFSFGFNNIFSEDNTISSSLVTLISKEATSDLGNGQNSFSYPKLTLSEISLGIQLKSLLPDLPVERQSLKSNSDGTFSLSTDAELNSFTPQASSVFLGENGLYTESRIPLQTITQKSSNTPLGWQYNPSFSGLYKSWEEDGTGTDGLFSAFQSTGAVYSLTSNLGSGSNFSRLKLIENETFFSFVTHLRRTGDKTTGSDDISILSGKNWGVVSFSLKPNSSTSTAASTEVVKATVSTYKWSTTESSVTQSQPISSLPLAHYETSTLARLNNLTNSIPAPTSKAASETRIMTAITNTEAGISTSGTGLIQQKEEYRGRLKLFEVSSNAAPKSKSIGSYSKDGTAITIALDESTTGRGFLQAIEMRTSTPVISTDTTYQLQGNSFGLSSINNIARNYGDSSLVLHNDGTCTLNLKVRQVKQNTTNRKVSVMENLNASSTDTSAFDNIAGTYKLSAGEIQISFANVEGSTATPLPMTLKGFVSKSFTTNTDNPGNLMILSLTHNNNIGLLYGFKEQSLAVNP